MELYLSPADAQKFKNYERVFAYSYPITGNKLKMMIDITHVKVDDTTEYGVFIQRYSPSEKATLK